MSCAPIFSKPSSSSISFAIVTPSFVISGAPNCLSSTTFLPFGPIVTLTVSASLFTPASSAALASAPNLISFAMMTVLLNIIHNCSVPSQLRVKMPSNSPSVIAFCLVCLGLLAKTCQNTSRDTTYCILTTILQLPEYRSVLR